MNIALIGSGRMGRMLESLCEKDEGLHVPGFVGRTGYASLADMEQVDAALDFSYPGNLESLLACAVAPALVKKPLRAVIIYMAYSIIMSVIWILLEAPDLALTEAAVGAGITGILFFLTLRRIDRIDRDADVEETQGEEEPHEENEATH